MTYSCCLQTMSLLILLLIAVFVFSYRETPVPSGPNSFGKTKLGFSQDYKIYERKLMQSVDQEEKAKKNS